MNSPKVLVGCPVSDKKHYTLDAYLKMVKSLTYPSYDIYLSDNSSDKNYHRNIYRKYGVECDWCPPEIDHPMAGICGSQRQIRRRVLYGGYDYFLSLEEDISAPSCVIELLMAHHRAMVCFPYFIGSEGHSQLAFMGLKRGKDFEVNRLIPFNESLLTITGKTVETNGTGLGCALIHRSVLERIDFSIVREKRGIPSDTYFYLSMANLGIKNYCDTSLIVSHNNQQWKIT